MKVVKMLACTIKGALSMGAIIMTMVNAEAASRGAPAVASKAPVAKIDPLRFCMNSCNDRCNDANDPLAPKLKAQCERMCNSDIISRVAVTQMSKHQTLGKQFNASRNPQERDQMMMANAPIYKCFATPLEEVGSETVAPVAKVVSAPADSKGDANVLGFCISKCNDKCLSNPDLKNKCQVCSNEREQIAKMQMNRDKNFRASKPDVKAEMLANAPINKCFEEAAPEIAAAPEDASSSVKEALTQKLSEMQEIVNGM